MHVMIEKSEEATTVSGRERFHFLPDPPIPDGPTPARAPASTKCMEVMAITLEFTREELSRDHL